MVPALAPVMLSGRSYPQHATPEYSRPRSSQRAGCSVAVAAGWTRGVVGRDNVGGGWPNAGCRRTTGGRLGSRGTTTLRRPRDARRRTRRDGVRCRRCSSGCSCWGCWQVLTRYNVVAPTTCCPTRSMSPTPSSARSATAGCCATPGRRSPRAWPGSPSASSSRCPSAMASPAAGSSPARSQPFLAASQAVPAVALAPMLVLWLGYGLKSVAALCALIVFFPMVVNTALGIRSLDQDILDAARLDGASWRPMLLHIEAPLALPYVLAGLRTALTLSITGAVVGEFVLGDRGLGGLLTCRARQFRHPARLRDAADADAAGIGHVWSCPAGRTPALLSGGVTCPMNTRGTRTSRIPRALPLLAVLAVLFPLLAACGGVRRQ